MPNEASRDAPRSERLSAGMDFLSELSRVIASNTELQPILDWMVQKTTTMLRADEGSIRLAADEPTSAPRTLIRKASDGLGSGSWPFPLSVAVMGYLEVTGEPLATPDLVADPRLRWPRPIETRIRAALVVPLRVGNRLTGMLAVTQTTPGRAWTQDEINLLSIVAAHSAGAIEQARLRAESIEKQRLEERLRREERDLEQARSIQSRFLPSAPLRVGAWEASGRVIPARQVGGDAFDCYLLDDGRLAVAIADVSGKGVPASLLMASLQALLRAHCDGRRPLAHGVHLLNQAIARTTEDAQFITAFCAQIDETRGLLSYVNAGHNPPLLRRVNGDIVELGEGELALGILADSTYTEHEIPFTPGDALLLYSDGITEAPNARGEMFGEPRLHTLWTRMNGRPPGEALTSIFAEVNHFRGVAEQSDDMTVVVVSTVR